MVLFVIAIGAVGVTSGTPARAADRNAAGTDPDLEFQPRLGSYHYEIHWGPKRVARVTIRIELEGDQYVLRADQKSTKFIDRIYRVRYRGETRIKVADLSPVESLIEEEVRKKKKVQEAQYDPQTGKVRVTETRSRSDDSAQTTKVYELQDDTGVVDLFSAIFLAQGCQWETGERHTFMIFIGRKTYHVILDCIGQGTYKLENRQLPVWIIRPHARKTTDNKASSDLEKTTIYLSADNSNSIVKIKSTLGIGTVRFRLIKHQE